MNQTLSIQLKAVFLLVVFSLNTVVGFACALGADMGFNISHHENDTEATELHVHADRKKHHHNQEPAKISTHIHQDGSKHHHDNESVKQPLDENQPVKDSKDCCKGHVQKFQNLDKICYQNTTLTKPVFTAIANAFFGIDIFGVSESDPPKYKDRFYHPPPPDIRIAIQSFQI